MVDGCSETWWTHLGSRIWVSQRMSMDNGSTWGGRESDFTALTVWLIRLGVGVSHSRPYHPQTQGKDERFHRTLQREVLNRYALRDLAHAQRRFDIWRDTYNLERPHEALAMDVPTSRYQPSPRSFQETLPPIEYDSGDLIRKVQDGGEIWFKGQPYKVGHAFIGQKVALRPSAGDGVLEVFYCHQKIRQLDLNPSHQA